MSLEKMPKTDSIQALAEFWDTHDLTDFEDQLEEVSESVFDRKGTVQIHLRPPEVEAVKRVADSRGIDYTDLIREWILERIRTA